MDLNTQVEIFGTISMMLGIFMTTTTIFSYNFVAHVQFAKQWEATLMFTILLLIFGILQTISTALAVTARNEKNTCMPLGIIGWVIIQFLIVLGIFSSYIVLNYTNQMPCYTYYPTAVPIPVVFHAVVLTNLVFLVLLVIAALWKLPKLLQKGISFKPETGNNLRVDRPADYSSSDPIFHIYSTSSTRELPPSYFE